MLVSEKPKEAPALLVTIRLGFKGLSDSNTLAFFSSFCSWKLTPQYFLFTLVDTFIGLHSRGRLPASVNLSPMGGGDKCQSAIYVNIMSMV